MFVTEFIFLKGEISEIVECGEAGEQEGLRDRNTCVPLAEQVTLPDPAKVSREAPQVGHAVSRLAVDDHAGVGALDCIRGTILILLSYHSNSITFYIFKLNPYLALI